MDSGTVAKETEEINENMQGSFAPIVQSIDNESAGKEGTVGLFYPPIKEDDEFSNEDSPPQLKNKRKEFLQATKQRTDFSFQITEMSPVRNQLQGEVIDIMDSTP